MTRQSNLINLGIFQYLYPGWCRPLATAPPPCELYTDLSRFLLSAGREQNIPTHFSISTNTLICLCGGNQPNCPVLRPQPTTWGFCKGSATWLSFGIFLFSLALAHKSLFVAAFILTLAAQTLECVWVHVCVCQASRHGHYTILMSV